MKMKILNLTQHPATEEQKAAGVIDWEEAAAGKPGLPESLGELLTFEELPTKEELQGRALKLARLAQSLGADAAMIGGAPYLMPPLEAALRRAGIVPLYAFSRRESIEIPQPDGSVRKTTIFRHLGFVEGSLKP